MALEILKEELAFFNEKKGELLIIETEPVEQVPLLAYSLRAILSQ